MADFSIDIDPSSGRLRIETGNMAGAHHASADEFIAMVEKLMGGEVKKKSKRKGLHHHSHDHSHQHLAHDHGHGPHSH